MKYNVTDLDASSFSGLLRESNSYMNGGLGYGLLMVFFLLTFAVLSDYPNIDALKASTYVTWIASIMFSVFGVVEATIPMAIFLAIAGLAGYQYVSQ